MKRLLIPAIAALLAAPVAFCQEDGDAARGLTYVQRHCADCHAVEAKQRVSPDKNSPAFRTVADTPGMTRIALTAWLQMPHRSMPQIIVPADRIADISAYLYSIRSKKR